MVPDSDHLIVSSNPDVVVEVVLGMLDELRQR
jgi:hypothetical protein